MMARASSKPLDSVAIPYLVPQGQHAGKQSMPISRPLTVIGSRHRAHLHLLSRTVSKSHAVVGMDEGGVYIRDLASRTHLYVNGKVTREADLSDGDLIKIGSFTFKYTDKRKSPLLDKPARPPAAAVEVEGSAVPIEFNGRVMLIGRRPTCDISLMEVSVSTCHAVIFESNGQRMIRDLGSRTGTYVNGQLIHQAPLNVGDQIRIGETDMKMVGLGRAPLHDELEDLVGTAPLGDEMLALAGEDLEPPPAPKSKSKPKPVKAKPPAARPAPPAAVPPPAPIPKPEPEPELEPEFEPAPVADAQVPEERPEVISAKAANIEPVVSEPEPALPVEEETPALAPPAIADAAPAAADAAPAVAEPKSDSSDVIKIDPDEPPHLLVDTNLYSDAMSGSGTFSGISGEVEQANSEAALDAAATEPVDLGLDFWHDEPPATADSLQADSPESDDAPLPLLSVEEPDDSAFAIAPPASAKEPESAPPLPEKAQGASTLGVSPEPEPAEPIAAAEAIAPVELGPELTAPPSAVEPTLPGLVVPAGAIERATEIAPSIPPSSTPLPSAAAEKPAEPIETIDLSNVQFSPPASEPAAEWEVEEPQTPAPTSLLGLDIASPASLTSAAEISLPRKLPEPQEKLAESVESAEPAASAEADADVAAPEVISELEPIAELAAEPADSYTPPPSLVDPIAEVDVTAAESQAVQPLELLAEETPTSIEPLAPIEESFEPALDLEPVDLESPGEIELPIENDAELVPAEDALEFNFDEPDEGSSPVMAEETGPAWIADAQTLLPVDDDEQILEPTSLAPTPMEEPELPLPAITESAPEVEPPAPVDDARDAAALAAGVESSLAPAAPSRLDPFRGMQNDLGSFIGGLPLPLPPVAKVPLDDGSSLTFPRPPAVPVAPIDVSEPPPELFDSEPEALDALPETLEKIEDVEQAIGEKQPAGVRPPGRLPPPPLQGRARPPFGSTPLAPEAPDSADVIAARKTKAPATARRGQVTTAFDGLALQPVRQADVFSQMSSPTVDDAFALGEDESVELDDAGGGAKVPPILPPTSLSGPLPGPPQQPGRRNSRTYLDRKGLHPLRPGAGGEAVDAELLHADPSAADFSGPGVEIKATVSRRALPAQPSAPSPRFQPMPPPPMPARFRRHSKWLRVGALLPLMILIAASACAAIWFLIPVVYIHTAELEYKNLAQTTDWQLYMFLKQERDTVAAPDTLTLAQQIYAQNGGKNGPGFLSTNGSIDKHVQLDHLLATMTVPAGSDRLQLQIDSNDRVDDALRLNALVHALNVKDKPLVDAAGRLNADFLDKKNRQNELAAKIVQIENDIKAEEDARDRLQALQESYSDLDSKVAQLLLARQAASRHVNDLEQEVHYLETSGAGVSTTQPAQTATPADDAESRDLAAQIEQVQSQLATIHSASNATADQANAALDEALRQFAQKVADAKTKLSSSSALSDYLASAQQVQDVISKERAEAAEETKSRQKDLTELKDHLADEQKRQNEAIWAADAQLQTWQQDLEIQQHHYEAAAGGGLTDDAAKIKADMDKLQAQIAARRDQLTAQNPSTADITTIRKYIDDWLDSMRKDQQRDDQQMADQIRQLASAAPNLSKLPTDQKALAEDLEKQQDQLDRARQQYAVALENGPQSDTGAKHLESQLADLNAKLATHRQELLAQTRAINAQVETSALEAQLKEKDAELTLARKQEDAAFLEYAKYKGSLADTKTELDSATALANKLPDDSANVTSLQSELDQQTEDVNRAAAQSVAAIVPQTPAINAVNTSAPVDRRWQWMLGAVFGTLLIFSPLIFIASQAPQPPRVPLARPEGALRAAQAPLPPRPSFATAPPPPSPLGDPPEQLTSLTATLETDAQGHKDAGEESSPDPIPANF